MLFLKVQVCPKGETGTKAISEQQPQWSPKPPSGVLLLSKRNNYTPLTWMIITTKHKTLFLKESQSLLLINSLAEKMKQTDNNNKEDIINIILCNWMEG